MLKSDCSTRLRKFEYEDNKKKVYLAFLFDRMYEVGGWVGGSARVCGDKV